MLVRPGRRLLQPGQPGFPLGQALLGVRGVLQRGGLVVSGLSPPGRLRAAEARERVRARIRG